MDGELDLLKLGFRNPSITTPDSSEISTVKVMVAASLVTSTVLGDAVRLVITGGLPSFSRTSMTLTVILCVVEFSPSFAITSAV